MRSFARRPWPSRPDSARCPGEWCTGTRGPATRCRAAWLVELDEDRIAAVARGYASQRVVGAAERVLLPAAVRFGACYVGAIHLHQALAEGVRGAGMDARLERLRNRVSVSEAVARLSVPHLAGGAEVSGGGSLAGGGDLAGGGETVR